MWKTLPETTLQGTVTHISGTETARIKITNCYAGAHVKLATGKWLMSQGGGRGNMGISKFEYWILRILAAVR